jgi:hypothetical protein
MHLFGSLIFIHVSSYFEQDKELKAIPYYSDHLKTEPWSVFGFNSCLVAEWYCFQMVASLDCFINKGS